MGVATVRASAEARLFRGMWERKLILEKGEIIIDANRLSRLVSPRPRQCRLNPGRTLIFVVDAQNEFLHPRGKYFSETTDRSIIPAIGHLLKEARAMRVPVIYTHSTRHRSSAEFSVFHRRPYALLEDSWGWRIIDELTPQRGDHVIQKSTHDCFHRTRMDALLRRLIGSTKPWDYQVVVTGIQTETCVYHAVIGLHVRSFRVVVPVDCVSGAANAPSYLGHLGDPAYSYNVLMSRSDLLQFAHSS